MFRIRSAHPVPPVTAAPKHAAIPTVPSPVTTHPAVSGIPIGRRHSEATCTVRRSVAHLHGGGDRPGWERWRLVRRHDSGGRAEPVLAAENARFVQDRVPEVGVGLHRCCCCCGLRQ
uniref:(northern house mosquito) hypothetical protein n=1 Tax=Culex pipiens TaxID=7175 RepID=A0A8D8CGB6_CULPI